MGLRVMLARKKLKMSQDELCKKVGISRCTLSELENDKYDPRRSLMLKLADALEVNAEELFFN